MVICSSDVAMSSGRAYQQQTRDRSSVSSWGEVLSATSSPTATDSRMVTQKETKTNVIEMYQNYSSSGNYVSLSELSYAKEGASDDEPRSMYISIADVHKDYETRSEMASESKVISTDGSSSEDIRRMDQVSDGIFARLFPGNDKGGSFFTLRDLFSMLIRRRQEDFERFMENFRIGMNGGSSVSARTVSTPFGASEPLGTMVGSKKLQINATRVDTSSELDEHEKTQFASTGKVMTADGRQIDFDLNLNLERSYEEKSESSLSEVTAKLTDPLVINFGTSSAELEDKTFSFDIDADGEMDNIAMLGQACGYLALDLNEDGIINDGSELFGTRSGDGFADLRIYDADGNGWIDENDPIFDKLKIWSKAADGTDQLVGLGVRGVGAIFLGNTPTEFSLKNDDNDTLGVIRSTGLFLREDGSAGTVQQLDLAKRDKAG